MPIGKAFKELGHRTRGLPKPPSGKPQGVKTKVPKSLSYERIKREVMAAIGQLSNDKRAQVPVAATLPEQMIALGLVWNDFVFQWQKSEDGGRLRVGGAVVDFVVWVGSKPCVVMVNGDYWHSLPARKLSDAVVIDRLRNKGYRVFVAWEHAIYQAFVDDRLKRFVADGVANAA